MAARRRRHQAAGPGETHDNRPMLDFTCKVLPLMHYKN